MVYAFGLHHLSWWRFLRARRVSGIFDFGVGASTTYLRPGLYRQPRLLRDRSLIQDSPTWFASSVLAQLPDASLHAASVVQSGHRPEEISEPTLAAQDTMTVLTTQVGLSLSGTLTGHGKGPTKWSLASTPSTTTSRRDLCPSSWRQLWLWKMSRWCKRKRQELPEAGFFRAICSTSMTELSDTSAGAFPCPPFCGQRVGSHA